jgi:hypothetical protein
VLKQNGRVRYEIGTTGNGDVTVGIEKGRKIVERMSAGTVAGGRMQLDRRRHLVYALWRVTIETTGHSDLESGYFGAYYVTLEIVLSSARKIVSLYIIEHLHECCTLRQYSRGDM